MNIFRMIKWIMLAMFMLIALYAGYLIIENNELQSRIGLKEQDLLKCQSANKQLNDELKTSLEYAHTVITTREKNNSNLHNTNNSQYRKTKHV